MCVCVWMPSVVSFLSSVYFFNTKKKLQNPSHPGIFKWAEFTSDFKKTIKGLF